MSHFIGLGVELHSIATSAFLWCGRCCVGPCSGRFMVYTLDEFRSTSPASKLASYRTYYIVDKSDSGNAAKKLVSS